MNLVTKILLGAGVGGMALYGICKLIEECADDDDDFASPISGDDTDLGDLFSLPGDEATTIPDVGSYGRQHG